MFAMPRVYPTSDEFPSPQDREYSRFISGYLCLDVRSAVDALAVQQRGELSRPALPLQAPWDPWAAQLPGDVLERLFLPEAGDLCVSSA